MVVQRPGGGWVERAGRLPRCIPTTGLAAARSELIVPPVRTNLQRAPYFEVAAKRTQCCRFQSRRQTQDVASMSPPLRVALLSPIAWRTPPRHYGPWESIVSLLAEGLVARGVKVTLFATADSETLGELISVAPNGYEENPELCAKVWECLHISEVFERAAQFDIIHNHFDYLPLSYSRLVKTPVIATIHGFSSPKILPVYQKYNGHVHYVSISDSDREPTLQYVKTVHHGVDLRCFTYQEHPEDYLLYFARIHPHKGTKEAIAIARRARRRLLIAGIIQDMDYFKKEVEPHLDGKRVSYVGSVGADGRDSLLGGAAALLHPISFDEPFGLSVAESMACGTPVIAFSRGSMPELIDHGVTGFLVENVEEAVAKVHDVAALSRRACRAHAERHFAVERMVDDYLQIYCKVAGRKAPRPPLNRPHVA